MALIYCHFRCQAAYQVSFAVSGLGSTNPSGIQSYSSGQVVVLSATPNSGFAFGSWSASPSNAATFQVRLLRLLGS